MPSATRPDLVKTLQNMGETVPAQWTCLQMRARIKELKDNQKDSQWNEMQRCMQALKTASKKKADLIQFAKDHQVTVGANDTIPVIFTKMERLILDSYPPMGQETVGFGEHSHLTYLELMKQCPGYIHWCLTISQEEKTGWRMQRLVKWVKTQTDFEADAHSKDAKGSKPKPKIPTKISQNQSGYSTSSEAFSLVSEEETDQVKKLKEELAVLKQEKAELIEEKDEMERDLGRMKSRRET